MVALTSRITPKGDEPSGPEDFLSTSLGVIFPDDVTNQHGDAEHSLIYASPHLPHPIPLDVSDPEGKDRTLFSHFLWNSSLLLAELIERDTLQLEGCTGQFNVKGLSTVELGAGTALPSIMAAVIGAQRLLVTDYPAKVVMDTLHKNVTRNIKAELALPGVTPTTDVRVQGHEWGVFGEDMMPHQHAFDRVFVCDCLWMPWQHENIMKSVNFLLKKDDPQARAWVVAGFHTGRAKMAGFFDEEVLRREGGLEVESIWERDCDGVPREWDATAEEEDPTRRKRWLAVAVLKRVEA